MKQPKVRVAREQFGGLEHEDRWRLDNLLDG